MGLIAALTVRILTGSSHIFYACNCEAGVFPKPFVYSLIYIIRILFSTIALGILLNNRYHHKRNRKAFLALLSICFIVIIEYKTLIGNESYLITLMLHTISVVLIYKLLKGCYIKNTALLYLLVILMILQIFIAYFTISLII